MKLEDIKRELIEGLGSNPPDDWNSIFWLFSFPEKDDEDWHLLYSKLMEHKVEQHHIQPEKCLDLLCEVVLKIQNILFECTKEDEEYFDYQLPCLIYGEVYGWRSLSAMRFHISKDSLHVDYEIWN